MFSDRWIKISKLYSWPLHVRYCRLLFFVLIRECIQISNSLSNMEIHFHLLYLNIMQNKVRDVHSEKNWQFLGSFEVEEGKPGWFGLNHFALSCHGTHFIKQTSWDNGVRCIRWSVTQIHCSLSLTRSLYFSHWQSTSDRCRSVWWDDWLLGHIYFPLTLLLAPCTILGSVYLSIRIICCHLRA